MGQRGEDRVGPYGYRGTVGARSLLYGKTATARSTARATAVAMSTAVTAAIISAAPAASTATALDP